jgi:hypothetical protein
MSQLYRVAAISADRVAPAFPLIQAVWPQADLASWQSFVDFFNDPARHGEAGVLGIYDSAGYACGVLAYRLDRDLRRGLTLAAQLFTAVDLINSLPTAQTVLDAAAMRAAELGCAGMQIRLPSDQTGLASRLRALGLPAESNLFWKAVSPPPAKA